MKGLDVNNLCSHGGDMLTYLYDEMAMANREAFEVHLSDCSTCIDDFAELSQSRYPVYEWKRTEFDPLPIPRVVIPVEETASISWFDKLRASLVFRPAVVFGSLAVVAIAATMAAFLIIGGLGSSEIAEVEPIRTSPSVLPIPERTIQAPEQPIQPAAAANESKPESPRIGEPKAVKASASDAKPAVRPARPKPTQQARRNEPLPTLNNVEEDEDDSLRLADIFEEIGTS